MPDIYIAVFVSDAAKNVTKKGKKLDVTKIGHVERMSPEDRMTGSVIVYAWLIGS